MEKYSRRDLLKLAPKAVVLTAILWNQACKESSHPQDQVTIEPITLDKETFDRFFDNYYEQALRQNLGYKRNVSTDPNIEDVVIDMPFVKDSKPCFVRISKGDKNDPNSRFVLINNYDGRGKETALKSTSDQPPTWERHLSESYKELTPEEMQDVINHIDSAVKASKDLPKYQEPVANTPISQEEFNSKFDELFQKLEDKNIGIPYKRDTIKNGPTGGREFYFVDPVSKLVIYTSAEKGFSHTPLLGRDASDPTARTINFSFEYVDIKGKMISSSSSQQATEFDTREYKNNKDKEQGVTIPKSLTPLERASVIKQLEIAVKNALGNEVLENMPTPAPPSPTPELF